MKHYRGIVLNLLLVLSASAFSVLVLEIAVRLIFPAVLVSQEIRTYHPKLSYQFLPNLDTTINTGTGERHLITNSYGYIGKEFPLVKPKGEYRIAHIGDSYVEGVQEVDWNKNFVSLIGEQLTKNAGGEEIFTSLNFGVSGRGQIEEYWVYKYLVEKINPDLVVLWVTEVNDLGNNYLPSGPPEQTGSNTSGKIKYYIKKSALATYLLCGIKTPCSAREWTRSHNDVIP